MTKYQLLPPLPADDLERLTRSIRERGVQVPVLVDEDGEILDGHHRVMVADALGVTYPTQRRRGLADFEKRLLAVSLNIDRRQMTDTELALLGQRIEPDIAERARQRQGTRTDLDGTSGTNGPEVQRTRDDVAAAVGLGSGRTYERHKRVVQEALAAGVIGQEQVTPERAPDVAAPPPIRELRAQVKARRKADAVEAIRREPPALPSGPFRVIVADPPWAYEKRAEDPTHRARLPYPSMTVEEIAALPVPAIAHPDCLLWLWTTNAHMRAAFDVLDAWGFEAKTILTWAKDRMGTGDWLRGQTEHCLLAVRGKPLVQLTNQTTLLRGPLREHSRKPEEFYALVESLCPGAKLELFARQRRLGWEAHGNEV